MSEVVKIEIDNFIEKIEKLDLEIRKNGEYINLIGRVSSIGFGFLNLELLNVNIKDAYIPTKGYLKKYSGGNNSWRTPHNLRIYGKLLSLLKEEGFRVKYYTEVEEI